MAIVFYVLTLLGLTVYSYALVDPNLTLLNHPFWESFRNQMVVLGYHQRPLSFAIFIILLILLFFFHYWFTKQKKSNPITLSLIIIICLLVAYPFLSHDFFNYLFDSKILTTYGQNPYLHRALDFSNDPWLRFMHWTHRTYPYGPIFLGITIIPSFLSFGKLILAFVFFKLGFALFYFLAVFSLNRINRRLAVFFATSPLVIIEGLVNNHNDLIAVSLALLAVYFVLKKKKSWLALVFFLFSAGIKYITLVFIPLLNKSKKSVYLSLVLLCFVLLLLFFKTGIYAWYFLNFLVLLPYWKKGWWRFSLLSFFLLLSYYPFLVLGGWDTPVKVIMKERIMVVGLLVFILSLSFLIPKSLAKFRLQKHPL